MDLNLNQQSSSLNILHDSPRELTYGQIDEELAEFEHAERRRLGLETNPRQQWFDSNPKEFRREQRESTTILFGGLSLAQDTLVSAALDGIGYQTEALPCPNAEALRFGREFGNRGQCNPTYFTVGNLIRRLTHLRDVENMPVSEIIQRYVFLTAGACGPCRFGTYATEYRKALRDAGFEGFRVLLFQQDGGLCQTTGGQSGLEFRPLFFMHVLKGILAGDVLNLMGYRMRPYEIERGSTDAALGRCREILAATLRNRQSVIRGLRHCRKELLSVSLNRLQPKPKVSIIGEFWAMTTEGDGNYRLQEFLESEGAEVDIQPVTSWLLYMIWQHRHDTLRRRDIRGEDSGRRGLRGRSARGILTKLWIAERCLRSMFRIFAWSVGLSNYQLPDMDVIAGLAHEHYDVELRGGEGHMEVGKLIEIVRKRTAHMVISVKPFGCMPSSGVSDGIQSAVLNKYPEAVFCSVETTGDGAVNFQSRIQMHLFKARRRAREEFEDAIRQSGIPVSLADAAAQVKIRRSRLSAPSGPYIGTAANLISTHDH